MNSCYIVYNKNLQRKRHDEEIYKECVSNKLAAERAAKAGIAAQFAAKAEEVTKLY